MYFDIYVWKLRRQICVTFQWINTTCVCTGYSEGSVQKVVPPPISSGNLVWWGNTKASFLPLISLPFYCHPPADSVLRVGWWCTRYLVSFFIDREGKREKLDAGRKDTLSRALIHACRGTSERECYGSGTCPFSYSCFDDNLTFIKKRMLGLK